MTIFHAFQCRGRVARNRVERAGHRHLGASHGQIQIGVVQVRLLVVSPTNFLPGVNPQTKAVDGSVRGYFEWNISKAATDSTEAKSVRVKVYESFDFNPDGEIMYTGLRQHWLPATRTSTNKSASLQQVLEETVRRAPILRRLRW